MKSGVTRDTGPPGGASAGMDEPRAGGSRRGFLVGLGAMLVSLLWWGGSTVARRFRRAAPVKNRDPLPAGMRPPPQAPLELSALGPDDWAG